MPSHLHCLRVLQCASRGLFLLLRSAPLPIVSTTARTVIDLPVLR